MASRRSKSNWRATILEVTRLETRRLLTIVPAWGGQSALDYVGPEAGAGPDGVYDDLINVSGINTSTGYQLLDVTITDSSFKSSNQVVGEWETQQLPTVATNEGAADPDGYAPAELIYTAGSSTAQVYINPYLYIKNLSNLSATNTGADTEFSIARNDQLTVTAYYMLPGSTQQAPLVGSDPPEVTSVTTAPDGEPTAGAAVAANPPQFTTGQVTASGWAQNPGSGLYPGWVQVTLQGVATSTIAGAIMNDGILLSKIDGQTWQEGSTGTNDNSSTSTSPGVNPLVLTAGGSSSTILSFPPTRDEEGSTMSLAIYYNNGTIPTIVQFPGQFSNPNLTVPGGNSTVAPLVPSGDSQHVQDLTNLDNALGGTDGIIQLGPSPGSQVGQYYFDGTIAIKRPVTIEAAPGATITISFLSPSMTGPAWTDAIEIESDQVTLDGFSINFDSMIPWAMGSGPAVIGDQTFAPGQSYFPNTTYAKSYLVGITLENLNITGPAAPPGGEGATTAFANEQSTNSPEFYETGINSQGDATGIVLDSSLDLTALPGVVGGQIINSTLTGGTVYISTGPWNVDNNHFQGAVAGMVSDFVINAGSDSHDISITDNHAYELADGGSDIGRVYRFFAITGNDYSTSFDDNISGNQVNEEYGKVGVLPDDLGTYLPDGGTTYLANENHDAVTEFFLVEDYNYVFEGKPLYVSSSNSRIMVIPTPLFGGMVEPGEVVSILSGPDFGSGGGEAGDWTLVDQVLQVNPTDVVLLLDQPMPADPSPQVGYAISVTASHVNMTIDDNTFNQSGTFSQGINLVGDDFNTHIERNTIIGGDELQDLNRTLAEGSAINVGSWAATSPYNFTYGPSFGTLIEDNTIVDSLGGVTLSVTQESGLSAPADQTFLTATVTGNTWEWDDNFVTAGTPFLTWVPPSVNPTP